MLDRGYMNLPETVFCEKLVQHNNLLQRGFAQLAFYPGMLFNAQDKWWGDGGRRASPHEGIDICLYRDSSGAIQFIPKAARIPVIYAGQVKRILDDYLGSTLYLAHEIYDSRGNQCYTIYGHVAPCAGIAPRDNMLDGEIVAAIADTEDRKINILPHVHISVAWIPESFPSEQLNWSMQNQASVITLLNPLDIFSCTYTVLEKT
jgi:hypothetical protein